MEEYQKNTQKLIECNKRFYDTPAECEWLQKRLCVNPSESILGTDYLDINSRNVLQAKRTSNY